MPDLHPPWFHLYSESHILRLLAAHLDRIERKIDRMSELGQQGFADLQAQEALTTQALTKLTADSATAASDLAADIAALAAQNPQIDFTSLIASSKANAAAATAADNALGTVLATQPASAAPTPVTPTPGSTTPTPVVTPNPATGT